MVVGVELATQIKEEIKVNISKNWFHTDSLTTYYRLQSKDKKQPVFVSNRVNKILLSTKAQEWRWVPTDLNPADVVSRGARPEEEEKWKLFYGGPAYIREEEDCWPEIPPKEATVGVVDAQEAQVGLQVSQEAQVGLQVSQEAQVGRQVSQESQVGDQVSQEVPSGRQADAHDSGQDDDTFVQVLLKRLSRWSMIVRVVAYVNRFVNACRKKRAVSSHLSVQELKEVEVAIVKDVQKRHFAVEIEAIKEPGVDAAHRKFNRSSTSQVKYLNPVVDGNGLLRIGGRLRKSALEDDAKYPIVLPSRDPVVEGIVWSMHKEDAHQGLKFTHSRLRERWWIIKGRQRVKSILSRCMKCKVIKARLGAQVMSDLPECCLNVAQVFAQAWICVVLFWLRVEGKE